MLIVQKRKSASLDLIFLVFETSTKQLRVIKKQDDLFLLKVLVNS